MTRQTGNRLRVLPSLAALLAFIALATAGRRANADPTSQVRLVWVRGERTLDCDDRATIARRVVERLGRDVFSESASRSIEGVIQHEGERWDAHLYVREADGSLFGSRYLTSTAPDCGALDAAVTLAIALAIDPDAALRPAAASSPAAAMPGPAAPSPQAPPLIPTSPVSRLPETPSTAPRLAAPVSPKAPEPPRGGSLSATARVLVAAGILPGAAAGAALSADGPAGSRFQGTGGLLYFPEARNAAGDFAFGLTAGWLGVCAEPWAAGRIAVAICGKILLGAIHAVVCVLAPDQPGDRAWSGASLSVGARFRIVGPLIAELGAEALVPLASWQFKVLDSSRPVFQQAPVAGLGFAGLGVSIP